MDIDFPLILLVLTVATGVIAAIDKFWLAKRRRAVADDMILRHERPEDIHEAESEPFVIEQAKSFFPVLLVVFVLRSFVAEPFQIPSGSMEPGLDVGDFILVSKFHYGLRMPVLGTTLIPIGEPQRGDVMVFFPPNDSRYFIKRVIGLPGDHVEYRNHQLVINGNKIPTHELGGEPAYRPVKYLAEEKLDSSTATVQWMLGANPYTKQIVVKAGPEGEWDVPQGHYLMMGDNRGNSSDGRVWGFVPEENIVGKAVAVWMHWESWSDLPSFSRNKWIK